MHLFTFLFSGYVDTKRVSGVFLRTEKRNCLHDRVKTNTTEYWPCVVGTPSARPHALLIDSGNSQSFDFNSMLIFDVIDKLIFYDSIILNIKILIVLHYLILKFI